MAVENLILTPSAEALICLTCTEKKCKPECKRIKVALKELKSKEKRKGKK